MKFNYVYRLRGGSSGKHVLPIFCKKNLPQNATGEFEFENPNEKFLNQNCIKVDFQPIGYENSKQLTTNLGFLIQIMPASKSAVDFLANNFLIQQNLEPISLVSDMSTTTTSSSVSTPIFCHNLENLTKVVQFLFIKNPTYMVFDFCSKKSTNCVSFTNQLFKFCGFSYRRGTINELVLGKIDSKFGPHFTCYIHTPTLCLDHEDKENFDFPCLDTINWTKEQCKQKWKN
jgi:hypothetical protein